MIVLECVTGSYGAGTSHRTKGQYVSSFVVAHVHHAQSLVREIALIRSIPRALVLSWTRAAGKMTDIATTAARLFLHLNISMTLTTVLAFLGRRCGVFPDAARQTDLWGGR